MDTIPTLETFEPIRDTPDVAALRAVVRILKARIARGMITTVRDGGGQRDG
jgi:hypothetical protein